MRLCLVEIGRRKRRIAMGTLAEDQDPNENVGMDDPLLHRTDNK